MSTLLSFIQQYNEIIRTWIPPGHKKGGETVWNYRLDFSVKNFNYFLVLPDGLLLFSLLLIKIDATDTSVLAPIIPANQGLSK